MNNFSRPRAVNVYSGKDPMTEVPEAKDMSVGERIRVARQYKGMTQQDLAVIVGVSRASVAQWETDVAFPSVARLQEVADALGVEAQWLAYSSVPGQQKVVYRNPERDNILWVQEIRFEKDGNPVHKDTWGIPSDFLRESAADAKETIICTVNSSAVSPKYEKGDRVFVDQSDTLPSPSGTFLYWDGIGMAYANMQAIPGPTPMVRISSKVSDTIDVPLKEVKIVGRVKARFQRG